MLLLFSGYWVPNRSSLISFHIFTLNIFMVSITRSIFYKKLPNIVYSKKTEDLDLRVLVNQVHTLKKYSLYYSYNFCYVYNIVFFYPIYFSAYTSPPSFPYHLDVPHQWRIPNLILSMSTQQFLETGYLNLK